VNEERSRWPLLAVFVLSTAINYLDRSTLAVVAPTIMREFGLTNEGYGWIVSAFFVSYTLAAPFAGILVDRIGLRAAAALAVGAWSCAGIATGFTTSLTGLAACRIALGLAEAGGIPAAGKAIHRYVTVAERGLGNAMNQAAVSLGLVIAPPLAITIATRYGWRAAFLVTGIFGLAWIPVWLRLSRHDRDTSSPSAPALVTDPRVWLLAAANLLAMVPYSLWTNFTVLYLVRARGLSLDQAKWWAWIPPALAAAGGFAGGWLSMRWVRAGVPAPRARFRVCLLAAVLSLVAAVIPSAPTVALASLAISLSFLAAAALSVNLYSLPIDLLGGANAGFAISMLTASAGAAALLSPYYGRLIDHYGYGPVTGIAAVTPLAACVLVGRAIVPAAGLPAGRPESAPRTVA
jgi:MFS transporter, ACS family, aldohexuronate transporter